MYDRSLDIDADKEVGVRKTCSFYCKVTSPAEYGDVCPCVIEDREFDDEGFYEVKFMIDVFFIL